MKDKVISLLRKEAEKHHEAAAKELRIFGVKTQPYDWHTCYAIECEVLIPLIERLFEENGQ